MDARLRRILREFRHDAETVFGDRLVKVVLFGSQARGDAREDSDIDVLVVLRSLPTSKERECLFTFLSDQCIREDVFISPLFMTEEHYRTGETGLLLNVAREGVAF